MVEIKETISKLEQKLSELIAENVKKDTKQFSRILNNELSFTSLAKELDHGIVLLSNSGQIEYCNPTGHKYLHSLKTAKDFKKLLSHFSESEQLFEFTKNIESFIKIRSVKKMKWNLDLISIDGKKVNVSIKIKILKYQLDSYLLLIFYPIAKSTLKFGSITDDLFMDKMGLLEKKAENLFEYNNDLKKTKEDLKKINLKKDKFFNIIAHDLRAPFNSILGLTEMLKHDSEELSPAEVTDLATRIHSNSKNVLAMVEDLLSWARMQIHHMEYNAKKIKIADAVFDALYLLKQEAALKGIIINTDLEEGISVLADQNMINLILRNLVSNAIKFTNKGGLISVSASSHGNNVKIAVQDNGIGIKDEDLEKILALDEHYTNLGTNNEKGTGLGLVLCMEFLSNNNSKLDISSKYGEGSTFSFELPMQ